MGWFKTWQENRTERRNSKWDAFTVAYQSGIDPRASTAQAVSSSIGSVSDALGKGLGQGGALSPPATALASSPWIPLVLIVVLAKMMKIF